MRRRMKTFNYILQIISLILISLGFLSLVIINIIVTYIEFGFIINFIIMPHWTMLISLGAIVLGFILFVITNRIK